MTCKECQGQISDYLNNNLPPRELGDFIRHVHACPECYEELETYFIVGFATRLLDEGGEVSYNIKGMLRDELDEKAKMLRRKKRRKRLLYYAVILLLIDVILTLKYVIELPFPLI